MKVIKNLYNRIYLELINFICVFLYKMEYRYFLKYKISEIYKGESNISELRVSVLSPIMTVTKILESHFGFLCLHNLQIHGIDVDTQSENEIKVNIRLRRPGFLIGKAGMDIDILQAKLSEAFNKKTIVGITEVKKDINMPIL